MKESYTYSNGNVLIRNINKYGLQEIHKMEYQDNIGKILETENIIEELENNKISLNDSIQLKKKDISRNRRNNFICILSSVCAVIITSIIAVCYNPIIMATGMHICVGLLSGIAVTSLSFPFVYNNLKLNKQLKKEINGNKLMLSKVIEQLNIETALLIKLKTDKRRQKEDNIKKTDKPIKVNYLNSLKQLKKYLALYLEIGSKKNEFKRYYKNDTLEEELSCNFTESEILEIKTYFKTHK